MTKLLVAGGLHNTNSVEVVNLDELNPDLICENLPGIPTERGDLFGSTGIYNIFNNNE